MLDTEEMIAKHSPEDLAIKLGVAHEKVAMGIRALVEASVVLNEAFGDHYDNLFPSDFSINGYTFGSKEEASVVQTAKDFMNRQAWSFLFQKTGIADCMSQSQVDRVHNDLRGKIPEFTPDNVRAWIADVKSRIPYMVVEAVSEVWSFLRPRHSNYKTNSEYEIGKKVILKYMVSPSWKGGSELARGTATQKIRSLDNVFTMLDGKTPPAYPGNFLTGLTTAMAEGKKEFRNEYFRCKWYSKTGTMHLEFLREDLLKSLTECAAGKTLKHDNATTKQAAAA